MDGLQLALNHFRRQAALAAAIGITQQGVSALVRRGGRLTAEQCIAIERATGGTLKRHELRPDLFDPPAEPASAAEEVAP